MYFALGSVNSLAHNCGYAQVHLSTINFACRRELTLLCVSPRVPPRKGLVVVAVPLPSRCADTRQPMSTDVGAAHSVYSNVARFRVLHPEIMGVLILPSVVVAEHVIRSLALTAELRLNVSAVPMCNFWIRPGVFRSA